MSVLLRYLKALYDTVGLEYTAVFFEIGIIKLTRAHRSKRSVIHFHRYWET